MKVKVKYGMKHEVKNETEEKAGLRNWISNMNGNPENKRERD